MAITRATNLAGLGTVFDALTDGGGLEITSGVSTISDLNTTRLTGTAVTFTNATITGDLTVQGTTTTLDTTVENVDLLEVGANSAGAAVTITQAGSGDFIHVGTAGSAFLISNSGYIGIGTDNPSTNLDVVADAASGYIAEFRQAHASNTAHIVIDSPVDGASRPSYMDYATGGTVKWTTGLAYLDSNRSFHIGTGSGLSNSKVTIKPDGNVGIGTDNPSSDYRVTIKSTTSPHSALLLDTTESDYNTNLYFAKQGINKWIIGNKASDDAFRFVAGSTEVARITGGGLVGIGSAIPNATLEVINTPTGRSWTPISQTELLVERDGNCYITISGNSANDCGLLFGDTDDEDVGYITYSHATDNLSLSANAGATQMVLTGVGGSVCIGSNDPAQKLEVRNGAIRASTANATTGSTIIEGRYTGDNVLNILGTHRSTGGTVLTYGLRPSTTVGEGFVSSYSNFSGAKTAIEVSNRGFKVHSATAATVAIGDPVLTTERFGVSADGHIGLGTEGANLAGFSAPSVNIGNGASPYAVIELQGSRTTNGAISTLYGYNKGGSSRVASITFNRDGANNSGAITLNTYASGSEQERVRIDSDGDVGIGENDPSCRLQVKDTATHTAYAGATPSVGACTLALVNNPSSEAINNHATIQFNVNGGTYNRVCSISAVAQSASNRYASLTFCTDDAGSRTEKLRITSGGQIQLDGTTGAIGFRAGSAGQFIVIANSGGFFHQAPGPVYYTVTTSGGSTSDETLKTGISTITNALDKISSINGVYFTFIDEPMSDPDKGLQLGVIAQEVETVLPEAVVTDNDGIKSVRYEKLIPPLIESVKELSSLVNTQQQTINNLLSRVTALENANP